jgi:hypothetical protein
VLMIHTICIPAFRRPSGNMTLTVRRACQNLCLFKEPKTQR